MTESIAAKTRKRVQQKVDAWRIEDAENDILIAKAKMEIARSSDNKIARAVAVILVRIEQTLAGLQKSTIGHFDNSVLCQFKDLDLSSDECVKLLPQLISDTGLNLEIVWKCTCAWNDYDHDSTCGNLLKISW